jgi:1-aminocyclopropane-1-carboxylate deaminase/D-cysteine desulfhydrase-like pyridoxal-dependent ACC family enzyme
MALAPVVLPTVLRQGDFIVGPGGSTLYGTLGYVDAAFELARQIDEGELPAPDLVVVTLGSAGTAAGLLAGIASSRQGASLSRGGALSTTRLVAVRVVSPVLMGRQRALGLSYHAAHHRKLDVSWSDLAARLTVEARFLGPGYGIATAAGDRATELAAREGIKLDPTYTAKTFAAALDQVGNGQAARILYWHTLSSAPLEPLLAKAPLLPPELDRLFTAQ